MIEPDKRNAVYQMHLAGVPLTQIARQLHLARNTARAIVRQKGVMPQAVRKDKIHLDPELLRRLYQECDGRLQRLHEKLVEEEKIQVSYSTLTLAVRDLELGQPAQSRCDHVPDEPGAEMQHDTSVYKVKLAGQLTRVIASLLYLRYSKRRYLRFYRVFNRFFMKCFLHEALMFWGYSARQSVIDNTNLARLRGSGSSAVIVPEMVAFAETYGFTFLCHAIDHPNRKAGEERSFRSVETSFLPGRTFESLEDLNEQARQWATVRMENRPASKTGLVPAVVFESERSYLAPLPAELPAPYCSLERGTDAYGYVSVEGNYYWVPGTKREDVKVLRYAERLKIYQQRNCVAEYPLPADGVKDARFHPEGYPPPRHQPKHKHGSQHEEQRLRALGSEVAAYLDYALQTPGRGTCAAGWRHRFLRALLALSRKVTAAVFVQALQRALRYRVVELATLERIAWLCISQGQPSLPPAEVDESFRERPAYQEGYLTDEPDLSLYDELPGQEEPQQDAVPQEEQLPRQEELPREENPPHPPESENPHE